MTLHALVAALGGDLYHGGFRASVPAPGHSPEDRSISLLLSDGRLIIHGFGGVDWRVMRDLLERRGFIDPGGRLQGHAGTTAGEHRPDHRLRIQTAAALWAGGTPITPVSASGRYLCRRAVVSGRTMQSLLHHPAAPVSVYRPGSPSCPALIARIDNAEGRLTAVELTYLEPGGSPASRLRLVRKTVGLVPAGAAVRLADAELSLVVGEGVMTTLSAMDRFGLPGWALGAANNLAVWSPPAEVRHVLIAADRGAAGEQAADRLERRLGEMGVRSRILVPDPPFGDWNEVAMQSGPRRWMNEGSFSQ